MKKFIVLWLVSTVTVVLLPTMLFKQGGRGMSLVGLVVLAFLFGGWTMVTERYGFGDFAILTFVALVMTLAISAGLIIAAIAPIVVRRRC